MSNDSQQLEQASLSPQQIEEYLQQHPEFFQNHLGLLENLTIPHPSGNAISLISKQLEMFRSKHHELETQLNTLIEIARENDTSFSRMHELTLALMEAKDIDAAVANLENVFSDCFITDFVAIRIIKSKFKSGDSNLFVDPDDKNLKHFAKELGNNKPLCGKPTLAQAKFLFGDAGKNAKSCAIIPMVFTQMEGLIAIGSRDATRFHHSMGNLFLSQISEVIGTRFIALLAQDHAS